MRLIPKKDEANLAIHKTPQRQRQRWVTAWYSSPGIRLTWQGPVPGSCSKGGGSPAQDTASACVGTGTQLQSGWGYGPGTRRGQRQGPRKRPRLLWGQGQGLGLHGDRDAVHGLGLHGDTALACAGTGHGLSLRGEMDLGQGLGGAREPGSGLSLCRDRLPAQPLQPRLRHPRSLPNPHTPGPVGPGSLILPPHLSPLFGGGDSRCAQPGPGVSTAVHPGRRIPPGLGAW